MVAGSATWKMFGYSGEKDGRSVGDGRLVVKFGRCAVKKKRENHICVLT